MAATIDDILADPSNLDLDGDLSGAVSGWIDHLRHEKNAADATIEAYCRDLRDFLGWLRKRLGQAPCLGDLDTLDAKAVRAFMVVRRRAGLESRSLARTMSSLRQFFRWLEKAEILESRAVFAVQMPKIPHGVPKPLTREKAAALVADHAGAHLDWIEAHGSAMSSGLPAKATRSALCLCWLSRSRRSTGI